MTHAFALLISLSTLSAPWPRAGGPIMIPFWSLFVGLLPASLPFASWRSCRCTPGLGKRWVDVPHTAGKCQLNELLEGYHQYDIVIPAALVL